MLPSNHSCYLIIRVTHCWRLQQEENQSRDSWSLFQCKLYILCTCTLLVTNSLIQFINLPCSVCQSSHEVEPGVIKTETALREFPGFGGSTTMKPKWIRVNNRTFSSCLVSQSSDENETKIDGNWNNTGGFPRRNLLWKVKLQKPLEAFSFGESPEWNQNQYASITGPFPFWRLQQEENQSRDSWRLFQCKL